MAKLYGKNAAVDFAAENLMSFGKSFSRLNGQPLDKSEVWYDDIQALRNYALTDAAYVGQRVIFVNSTANTVTNYCIQTDGSLKEIGTSPIGDNSTIVVAANGTVSLAGISGLTFTEEDEDGEEIEVSYQPLMTGKGLVWVRPSATTVEGLATEIEGIKKDIGGLQDSAKNVYTKDQVYTKDETDDAIDAAKTEVLGKVMGEAGIEEDYDTLKEIADWILSDTTESSKLVTRVTNAEKKLENIEENAQVNKIESVDENQFAIDANKNLTLLDIAMNKITGLSDALAGKVATETGKRLMTDDEGNKLANIEAGAEVNYIKSVDSAQFGVSEAGHLTLQEIAQSKVTGLADALAGKVNAQTGYRMINADEAAKLEKLVLNDDGTVEVGGTIAAGNIDGLDSWVTNHADNLKGLSENNFNDSLLAKLNAIEENAQANTIEEVLLGDSVLTATNKKISIPVGAGLKASTEVTIGEDGALGVGTISIAKLDEDANTTLVLKGGNAN